MKKLLALVAICGLSALALGACGDDDEGSGGSAATTSSAAGGGAGAAPIALAADASAIAYDTDSLTAKAGAVTIDFDNPAPLSHDVCLEGSDGEDLGCSDEIAQDQTTYDAGNLQPGDYTFYCSVDGHREQGMEGTLTVE